MCGKNMMMMMMMSIWEFFEAYPLLGITTATTGWRITVDKKEAKRSRRRVDEGEEKIALVKMACGHIEKPGELGLRNHPLISEYPTSCLLHIPSDTYPFPQIHFFAFVPASGLNFPWGSKGKRVTTREIKNWILIFNSPSPEVNWKRISYWLENLLLEWAFP